MAKRTIVTLPGDGIGAVVLQQAILADVGKLLEYELNKDGKAVQGKYGQYLRHPFSGVSLA